MRILAESNSPSLEAFPVLHFPLLSGHHVPQFLRGVGLPYPQIRIVATSHDKPVFSDERKTMTLQFKLI